MIYMDMHASNPQAKYPTHIKHMSHIYLSLKLVNAERALENKYDYVLTKIRIW